MQISTSVSENGVVQLEIKGEVDAYTARELDKALKDLLALGHSRLVLDASQMGFISSVGLRVILFNHREACRLGGEVRVFGLNAQVRRVFEIAGFDELFQISDTYDEAVAGW
jgi:anti-sigma B factor antagonist